MLSTVSSVLPETISRSEDGPVSESQHQYSPHTKPLEDQPEEADVGSIGIGVAMTI